MKPITLYLALTLTAVLGAAIADAEQYLVRDEDGNPVETDVGYYVLPFASGQGNGGGLILESRPGEDLPDVVQSSDDSDLGYPVKFHSLYPYVSTSKKIQIEINDLYWWLDEFDPNFNETFVTTQEVDNVDSSSRSFFEVVEVEEGRWGRYKFVFSLLFPLDIGIFTDTDQIRRLAINITAPYEVKFKRVPETKKFNRPFIALRTSGLL